MAKAKIRESPTKGKVHHLHWMRAERENRVTLDESDICHHHETRL
jgi:hypothetical protein